jgi:hypothetical protein
MDCDMDVYAFATYIELTGCIIDVHHAAEQLRQRADREHEPPVRAEIRCAAAVATDHCFAAVDDKCRFAKPEFDRCDMVVAPGVLHKPGQRICICNTLIRAVGVQPAGK